MKTPMLLYERKLALRIGDTYSDDAENQGRLV